MSRLLISGLIGMIFFLSSDCLAQSEFAYIKAGDEALRKNDPVAATAFYNEALAYNPSASTMLKLSEAWQLRFNFRNALSWSRKALAEGNPSAGEITTALVRIYDLHKRMSAFELAGQIIYQVNDKPVADSLRLDFEQLAHHIKYDALTRQLPAEINSGYSDFAPQVMRDSTLIYSSNRFRFGKEGKTNSKILQSVVRSGKFTPAEPMKGGMNLVGKHTANASVSQDNKLMVFSVCHDNEENSYTCELYESVNRSGEWTKAKPLPEFINAPGKTTTQPCIRTNREKGYVLYFVSDRDSGKGGMDIWQAERDAEGTYLPPVNLSVNGPSDDLTPFLDGYTDTLYFASERNGGFGGLDIWKVRNGDSILLNGGTPFNSGYDDLYPVMLTNDQIKSVSPALIVSNRPPSLTFHGETCCFDIFRIEPVNAEIDSSRRLAASDSGLIRDTSAWVAGQKVSMDHLLPLRLYFDNDYPDPRSRSATTSRTFTELVQNYIAKSAEFVENSANKDAIRTFFTDSVQDNIDRLRAFTEVLAGVMELGYSAELTLQGSASPLADSRYNVILSERRIQSLLNDWEQNGPESLKTAIREGRLKITRQAAGESLAGNKVADRSDLTSESVYGLKASQLRRIEITALSLSKP